MKKQMKHKKLCIATMLIAFICVFSMCGCNGLNNNKNDIIIKDIQIEKILNERLNELKDQVKSAEKEIEVEEQEVVRDRNEEKKEALEQATLAVNSEDIINEDYSPKPNLADEELRLYLQKIFLDICREPEKIEKYKSVFTEESINRFKDIEWKYENPKEFYDFSLGYIDVEDNDRIRGSVSVDSKYAIWELAEEDRGEENGHMA